MISAAMAMDLPSVTQRSLEGRLASLAEIIDSSTRLGPALLAAPAVRR